MRIQAVAFDIDGTLYPNPQMFIHSLGPIIAYSRLFYHYAAIRRRVRDHTGPDSHVSAQTNYVADKLRIPIAEAETRIRELYRAWDHSFRGIRPFRGVARVLGQLQQNGVRMAALSDFPVGRKLQYLGVEKYFDFSFCSESTNYLKPHPAPFQELSQRLEIPPHDILYVGNSYSKDIVGAHEVGMMTAWIVPQRFACRYSSTDDDQKAADIIFSRYKELIPRIQQRCRCLA